jgi:hypothetical protein
MCTHLGAVQQRDEGARESLRLSFLIFKPHQDWLKAKEFVAG